MYRLSKRIPTRANTDNYKKYKNINVSNQRKAEKITIKNNLIYIKLTLKDHGTLLKT